MKRRNFLKGVAVGSLAATTTPVYAQGKQQWRMLTGWGKNTGIFRQAEAFAKLVGEASDGQLTVEALAAEAGNPREIASKVGQGAAEMGHGVPALWAKDVPAALWLLAVPFGLTAQERIIWFEQGDGQKLADEAFGEIGCKYFQMGDTGCQMGGWFKREIRGLADLKGLRVRYGEGREILRALGANPVSLPLGKIAEAFEKGELDAAEAVGPGFDMALGLHKHAKYYFYPGWQAPSVGLGLIINKAKWEGLPRSLKAVVRMAVNSSHQRILSGFYFSHYRALKALVEEHSVQLRRFPNEVLKALAEHANSILPTLAAKDEHSKKVYDSTVAFRQAAHSWSSISDQAYLAVRTMVMS